MRLAGKSIFITGGSSGIGLATAMLCAREGAQVAITGRNRERLDEAVAQIGGGLAFEADVADDAAMEEALTETHAAFGTIHAVFANAGLGILTEIGKATRAEFAETLSVNVTSVFMTIQAALRHMPGGGSIIINGSVSAGMGPSGRTAYAASKGAVHAMAKSLASELSPRGFRVNVVVPGTVATPIWEVIAPDPGGARPASCAVGRARTAPPHGQARGSRGGSAVSRLRRRVGHTGG